jgi:2-polyprenyl-3-methyl-5-hydroxy-6-metoxy-1,4-benzoquinol methylase
VADEGVEGRAANKARWEESVPLHAASDLYDLATFRAGRDDIRPFERVELGSVQDLDLVHLQCHIGTDTLSWARHGARVVGLDFSAAAIEVATQLALDCGLDAEFVCSDVYDARHALAGRSFDIVYTGIGALGWLHDMGEWARVVDGLLRPGGVLYLVEIHPTALGVMNDGQTLRHDIFEAEYRRWDDKGGTYAAQDATFAHTTTFERIHSLSEVISAVLNVGLTIELVHEQSFTNVPWAWAPRSEDGYYRLPDGWPKFPLTYSLKARKSL